MHAKQIIFILVIYDLYAGHAQPPYSLVVTPVGLTSVNGLVWATINDNLTLICSLQGERSLDGLQLMWLLPSNDTNRLRYMWADSKGFWLKVPLLGPADSGTYKCYDRGETELVSRAYVGVRHPGALMKPPYCGTSMFPCTTNAGAVGTSARCVPYSYICDGIPDCPAPARDEDLSTCGSDPCQGKLMCSDHRCIPRDWCCNGRKGPCLAHPCCDEHEEFMKLGDYHEGGGLRGRHGGPPLLQTTLYTVAACLLIFLIAITLLISAICKARLKRVSGCGDPSPDDHSDCPNGLPDYRYTLVSDPAYGSVYRDSLGTPDTFRAPRNPCPPYDRVDSPLQLPTYNEAQLNTVSIRGNVASNSPARRPTDFGVGTLANAIFNSRYRPVPQNAEAPTFAEMTDSDSSCRSPGSHTWNRGLSPGRSAAGNCQRSPSHFEVSGMADNGRLRRANALDRILDRFGLNAPYAVEREGHTAEQSQPESESFLSSSRSPQRRQQSRSRRRRFVSSILARLRNGFSRNSNRDEATAVTQSAAISDSLNNNVTQNPRRPDTPNVVELSLDRMEVARSNNGETYTLNGRTIHLLGASFEERPELYNLGLQGLYIVDGIVGNLNRFVGRPVSPPPYSEVVDTAPPKLLGPPPPYRSRENLTETSFNAIALHPLRQSSIARSESSTSDLQNLASITSNNFTQEATLPALLENVATLAERHLNARVSIGSVCTASGAFDDMNGNALDNPDNVQSRRRHPAFDLSISIEVLNNYQHNSTPSVCIQEIQDDDIGRSSDQRRLSLDRIISIDRSIDNLSAFEREMPSCSKLHANNIPNHQNNDVANINLNCSEINDNVTEEIIQVETGDDGVHSVLPAEVHTHHADTKSRKPDNTVRGLISSPIDQNENPSIERCDVSGSLNNLTPDKPRQRVSVFPPVSLEFIDSDCITD